MKKFLGIPLAIIAAMTAVSCIDEIDDPVSDDQQGELVEMTFTASFADDTKTTLTDGTSVWWQPGDQIIVNGNLLDPLAIEKPAAVAEFTGSVNESDTYYAIYPASNYWSGSEVPVDVTTTLPAVKNDLSCHISAAKSQNTDLYFKNALGYIRFEVTDKSWEIESVKVKANGGEPLTGSFTLDYSGNEPVLKPNGTTYPYAILKDVNGLEPGYYYISLAPGVYKKGLTFEFRSTDGKIGVKHIKKEIELGRNRIQSIGNIDNLKDALAAEREALIAFYNATGGESWTFKDNWCTDKPLNEWYGVTTDDYVISMGGDVINDGSGPGFVSVLQMQGNNLTGSIPEEISNLKHLKYLSLGSNSELGGSLPASLFEVDSLRFLHIHNTSVSGSLPENVGNAENLRHLYLSFNNLSGEIPSSVYNLKDLELLRLDWNDLEGTLSSDISRLTKLTDLNLEANDLSGNLPSGLSVIMNNDDLWSFSIGGNKFYGVLPDEIVGSNSFHYLWPTILNQDPVNGGIDKTSLTLPAPDETWTDWKDQEIDLSDIYSNNELTLLYKFGTWCPYSQNTTVKLLPLYEAYHEKGLEIIGYGNVDWSWSPRDSYDDIENHITTMGIKWPVVIRDCGWIEGINNPEAVPKNDSRLMGALSGSPSVIAVDKTGNVVYESVTSGYSGVIDFIAEYLGDEEVTDPDMYESEDYSMNYNVVTLQTHTEGSGIDIVFVGDGFVDTDMAENGVYETVMKQGMEALFSEEPMKTYREYFDVHAVKAVSKHNIISESTTTTFDTWFGSGTSVGGDDETCFDYARKVEGIDLTKSLVICIMNQKAYAGTCYMYYDNSAVAYFPLGYDDEMFRQLLNHEAVGHGFGKLLDEYEENIGNIPSEMKSQYLEQESMGWGANVDIKSDPSEVNWAQFLADERYGDEGLGVYEGALTYQYGAYRPSFDSIMRHNTGGFNAPSRYEIYRRIMSYSGQADTAADNYYEAFVAYDAINRKSAPEAAAQRRRANYVEQSFVPTAPPVFIKGSWKDAVR